MDKNTIHRRINDQIRAPLVRVINSTGAQLGILKVEEAKQLAVEEGLDLVEIVPDSDPPVCKIISFDKLRYSERKAAQERQKNQKKIQVKALQFRPTTDVGDYEVKLRNLKKFIENGDKVRVVLRFRGRELLHSQLGDQLLKRLQQDTIDIAVVEHMPKLEGRQLVMVLAPKRAP